MDYVTVTQAAFFTAVVSCFIAIAAVLLQYKKVSWNRVLLPGLVAQTLWALSLLYSYSYSELSFGYILSIEYIRLLGWLITLILLLSKRLPVKNWPRKTLILGIAGLSYAAYGFYSVQIINQNAAINISASLLMLSVTAVSFTEQVVRNLNTHRMIKLIGLCLSFAFIFDVLMYGNYLISQSIPNLIWQARAGLAFITMFALAVGSIIFTEKGDSKYIFSVSRPVAFFSSTFLISAVIISLILIGSYFVKNKGYLGTYLFSLSLICALLIIFTLTISSAFRQQFEVFISKHFFALKYDYRIEWLKTIKQLSELNIEDTQYYSSILNFLCTTFHTKGGSFWLRNNSELTEVYSNFSLPAAPSSVQIDNSFIKKMIKESWIYAPQSRSTSLSKNNSDLPDWISDNENIWMVAPMIIQMKLVGFIILEGPKISSEITFEDLDLMTNIGTQIASHILLHQQERLITSNKQMETYNRLSAFIMHDINNVIAQLSLISKNAQRHKNNPAFIEDMIKTVENASNRMQSLIQKFNPASKENRAPLSSSEVLSELLTECSVYSPIPTLEIIDEFTIYADKHKLVLALKNLLRNAQEATDPKGQVRVTAQCHNSKNWISIKDDGVGMSKEFIAEELFRPFSTTKSENGVGIGAYLTRSYLEHIDATLNVTSSPGNGTTFTIAFN